MAGPTKRQLQVPRMCRSTRLEQMSPASFQGCGVYADQPRPALSVRLELLTGLGHRIGRPDVRPCSCGWQHIDQRGCCSWCGAERPTLLMVHEPATMPAGTDTAGHDAGMDAT